MDLRPELADPREPQLMRVVAELVAELHPGEPREVHLDARIEGDLGLDSLGRVELMLRIDRAFGVRLDEQVLADADTARDVLQALAQASPVSRVMRRRRVGAQPGGATAMGATTLVEALSLQAARQPGRVCLVLSDGGCEQQEIDYATLFGGARAVAGGLQSRGVRRGDRVALMLPTGADFFRVFAGVLLVGAVPVPIYPPFRRAALEDHVRRQAAILDNCQPAALVTAEEARTVASLLRGLAQVERVVTPTDLAHGTGADIVAPRPSDLALLQYTSGSTGEPKGVMLTHENLMANIRAMCQAARVESSDVFVSWLPLYHDMGLIGMWLASMVAGAPLVALSPLTFLADPASWLWALCRHRGTVSAAPNFAFELCARKVEDSAMADLDLGSVRFLANGAEPVSPRTLERFLKRFAPAGLRPSAVAPVYGLAECGVGLAFPPLGREPRVEHVDRRILALKARAVPAREGEDALALVACGGPLPGHDIRIVDAGGNPLPPRCEGRVQIRGPSCTAGYYRREAETQALYDGEWLETGDRGYLSGGDIFITGRTKDLIIRAGRNIYPTEIEAAVGEIDGVRRGSVAVFGVPDERAGTERVVVLAETYLTDARAQADLAARVRSCASLLLEEPPSEVVLGPPHSVLKTSSGKIRRAATRERYQRGLLDETTPPWRQLLRLWLAGLGRALRPRRRPAEVLYAAWWWLVLVAVGSSAWLAVALLPRRTWRWRAFSRASRAILWLTATPLTVRGTLPPDGVLVSNHDSYIDGLVIAAALGGPFTFIAKRELRDHFVTRVFMERLGSVFVERHDKRGSMVELMRSFVAERPLYFPEGTTAHERGLAPFRMGAFITAVRSSRPIVPIALGGTASVLPDHTWFPHRHGVTVSVAAPLQPEGAKLEDALRLRAAARRAILELANLEDPQPGSRPGRLPARHSRESGNPGRNQIGHRSGPPLSRG